MSFRVVPAYAKINLSLEVGERRKDGFHSLSSIFVGISLHDTLFVSFHRFGKKRVRVFMNGKEADESNSMVKAALLYRNRFYPDLSVTVRCRKRIPAGGGLGGGSSDAAAVLAVLNRKYGKASQSVLAETAAEIGSDVPFFLSGKAAYVSGRGESVRPIPTRKKLYGVLILPDYFSSTAAAYRMLDESGSAKKVFRNPEREVEAFYGPLSGWPYDNDFLPVLEKHSPLMRSVSSAIAKLNPPFWNLSGSGSSLYALFESRKERQRFFRRFNEKNVRKKNFFLV